MKPPSRSYPPSPPLQMVSVPSPPDWHDHQILLTTELGIADSALTWFTSYLTNCTLSDRFCFHCTDRDIDHYAAITSHGFSYHCYADDTQLFLSLPPLSCISKCLADISTCTAVHHLKLNLSKTELLFLPGKRLLSHCQGCHDIAFVVGEKPGRDPQ